MKVENRRKLKVSLQQATELAIAHVAKQDLNGWQCDFVGGRRLGYDPDHWVLDAVFSKPGWGEFDNSGFVVNGRTGKVQSWDEHFEEESLSRYRE